MSGLAYCRREQGRQSESVRCRFCLPYIRAQQFSSTLVTEPRGEEMPRPAGSGLAGQRQRAPVMALAEDDPGRRQPRQ